MNKRVLYIASSVLILFGLLYVTIRVFADQSGDSPDSGSPSRIIQIYDFLVDKGGNYGDVAGGDWSEDWGSIWNRITYSATWEPLGTAEAEHVLEGFTFFSTDGRTLQTGTLELSYDPLDYFSGQALQSLTAGTQGNATWTQTSTGGDVASVTLRSTTIALSSNTVMQDGNTGLYWSERSASAVSNNTFASSASQTDRVNPATNLCNFNSAGTANAGCNTGNTGVSANELCLNLSLDSNGDLTPETDWRLPTYKELMQAYINGAATNLANVVFNDWSSTQNSATDAWSVVLSTGATNPTAKAGVNYFARCVRG